MQASAKSRPVYEKLDTAYVNLAALLRYLQRRNFTGRVHVEMNGYEAEVRIGATGSLDARETDHAMGREAQGEATLQRLIVRAMEAGGLISIYEETEETDSSRAASSQSALQAQPLAEETVDDASTPEDEADWGSLLRLSAEIIG